MLYTVLYSDTCVNCGLFFINAFSWGHGRVKVKLDLIHPRSVDCHRPSIWRETLLKREWSAHLSFIKPTKVLLLVWGKHAVFSDGTNGFPFEIHCFVNGNVLNFWGRAYNQVFKVLLQMRNADKPSWSDLRQGYTLMQEHFTVHDRLVTSGIFARCSGRNASRSVLLCGRDYVAAYRNVDLQVVVVEKVWFTASVQSRD
jgi:hypothetical protein